MILPNRSQSRSIGRSFGRTLMLSFPIFFMNEFSEHTPSFFFIFQVGFMNIFKKSFGILVICTYIFLSCRISGILSTMQACTISFVSKNLGCTLIQTYTFIWYIGVLCLQLFFSWLPFAYA